MDAASTLELRMINWFRKMCADAGRIVTIRHKGEAVLIEGRAKLKRELGLRDLTLLLLGCSVFAIPALVIYRRHRATSGE